jgi:hypothetical protein
MRFDTAGGGLSLHYDSTDSNEDSNYGFVSDCSSRCDPAQSYNRACLHMTNDSARNWASLGNNEELGHVDDTGK